MTPFGDPGDLARQINDLVVGRNVPVACWYAGCQESTVRPTETCDAKILTCVQISRDNDYTSGGGQSHQQACNFGDTEPPPPTPPDPPPRKDDGTTGGVGTAGVVAAGLAATAVAGWVLMRSRPGSAV